MTCNLCGINEATIHLTEIVNSQMIEIHLCESCAQEKGTDFKTHFNFGDILAGLAEPGPEAEEEKVLRCEACGMIYDEFAKSGRLGCAHCYDAFSRLLMPLIKRVQRAGNHIGKKPSRVPKMVRASHDLRLLQDRLAHCIESEEFEEAAKVRDEIKKILDKVKSGKK